MAALSFDDLLDEEKEKEQVVKPVRQAPAQSVKQTEDPYRWENLTKEQLKRIEEVNDRYDINRTGMLASPNVNELFNSRPLEKRKIFFEALNGPSVIPTAQAETPKPARPAPAQRQPQGQPTAPTLTAGKPLTFEDLTAEVTEVEEPKVKFEELYTNKDNLKTIRDYAETRFGKSGKQKEGESDQDYVKRWMTAMRQTTWNTTINAVPELNWIYNAKKEDVEKAAKAHQLFGSVLNWYQTGGQPGVRPFAEATLAAVSDPMNLLGFGIGAFGRYKAARAAVDTAIKARIAAIGGGAAAEALVGTSDSLVQQQLEVETGQRSEVSATEAAIAGLLSSAIGGTEAATAFRKPKKTTKQELEEVLADRKAKMPEDKDTAALIKAFDEQMDETLKEVDVFTGKIEGRKTLDELSAQTVLTQAEIKKDINTRAINVAEYILLNDPAFSETARRVATKQQKVSNAVREVFSSIDNINEDVLDAAIQKSGLTLKEFADATRTTVADAASIMQSYSALSKVLRNQVELDPAAKEVIDKMYGRNLEIPDALQSLSDGIVRLERESKALVVSSIATTMRNVMGSSMALTFDADTRLMEGTLYQMGKVTRSVAKGTYEQGDVSRGLQTVVRDAFGSLTYMTNAGITAEITDKLLIDNPRIREQLLSALQETGTQNLSKVARMANTFNVGQDVFYRRGVFTASVERQLRNVGMDMFELLAQEKAIPADILKNAADEALKSTFSYMPKKGVAHHFVRFWEKMPGGSLLVTFPRFMTNAMAFQARYSPIGAAFGANDFAKAALSLKKDPLIAERFYREGMEKMIKGSIGTSALYAAYQYRLENQESEWYNFVGEDGSTVDTRAIFPIAPYLAVGDFMAKAKINNLEGRKVDEYIQAIVGIKVPSGSQGYLINQIAQAFQNSEGKEAERFEKALGSVFGDFASRFLQTGQPIYAFFDQFDYEDQLARDPNVLEGDSILTQAALNRVKVRSPIEKIAESIMGIGYTPEEIEQLSALPESEQPAAFKALSAVQKELPVAVRYLREETPVRAGEFFNVLTGVRVLPRANELERQFTELAIDPYTVYGSSGDKTYDRSVIKNTYPFIKDIVIPYIQSEAYSNLDKEDKKVGLYFYMREALSAGREMAQAEMSAEDIGRVNKMKFNKLPKYKRDAINRLYKADFGQTMDEAKAYDSVDEYEGRILEALAY
jgi:hypothetical protein